MFCSIKNSISLILVKDKRQWRDPDDALLKLCAIVDSRRILSRSYQDFGWFELILIDVVDWLVDWCEIEWESIAIEQFLLPIEVTPANSVHMLWLLPQYFIMTVAEVMFSVTGLQFSFTQVEILFVYLFCLFVCSVLRLSLLYLHRSIGQSPALSIQWCFKATFRQSFV